MKRKEFKIPTQTDPVFIIAELSANHNNNFDLAVKTIEAMAESGADAVKIQTYTADSLTLDVDNEFFGPRKDGLWKGKRPFEIFQEGSLPYEWQPKLKTIAENLGLVFFSSPFDLEGVEFLERVGVELYKVASPEINDVPLIRKISKTGKPMILSTGMADEEDIRLAIETIQNTGKNEFAILKCTSQYPAKFSDANLKTIPDMIERFQCTVGVSDHSEGYLVPTVAVSLGAKIVEKHFILDRSLGGIDSAFSMEQKDFAIMVKSVRDAEQALGHVEYKVSSEDKLRRRSLFVVNDIEAGELFTEKNIRSIRPGHGLEPSLYDKVIGKKANTKLQKGTPLSLDLLN
ncbi:MAG: pseudaminic acid synthase [Leptospira sp.]|nr:MAG: pseudaminic acid synthase [Leptospira sp.]